MRKSAMTFLIAVLALGSTAMAGPGREGHRPDRQQRIEMMKKIHTGFLVELGALIDLDTAGTLKLGEQLKPYNDQRVQLRLEMGDTMDQLRQIAKDGGNNGEAASLARRISQLHVQLAQLDQQQLDVILKSVPADKVAKVAVFCAEDPKRIERMAHEIHREHGGGDHRGGDRE